MNKTLITERFTKAAHTYGHEAEAPKRIAEHMAALPGLHLTNFCPNRIAALGCGPGNYSRLLFKQYFPKEMLMNDICGEMRHCCKELLEKGAQFEVGDAEHFCFPKECDLITSWLRILGLKFSHFSVLLESDSSEALEIKRPLNSLFS